MEKKIFGGFALLSMLLFLILSANPVAANDSETKSGVVSGIPVSAYNTLSYVDVRCGMNTKGHYSAIAGNRGSTNIDKIGISYSLYDWNDTKITNDSRAYTNSPEIYLTTNTYVIDRSSAVFTFEESGSSWYPGSEIFHCLEWSTTSQGLSIEQEENTIAKTLEQKAKLENKVEIASNYMNINQKSNEEIKSLAKSLFDRQNYQNQLEGFTIKGEQITFDDLKISKKTANKTNRLKLKEETLDLVYTTNKDTYYSTIILSQRAEKDGNKFNIYFYVNGIGGENVEIDYGLKIDKYN